MSQSHGGNLRALAAQAGKDIESIIDFSANINPLGPPAWLRTCVSRTLSGITHYPDPDATDFMAAASKHCRLPAANLVVGNGSTEIINALPRVLKAKKALIVAPAYTDYARASSLNGLEIEIFPLSAATGFQPEWEELGRRLSVPGTLAFLGTPNNPTGNLLDIAKLRELAMNAPNSWLAVDEAFLDFVPEGQSLSSVLPGNAVVLKSLTKFYAIPGLRIGIAMAKAEVAKTMREHLPPWSVNTLALEVGRRALEDTAYAQETRDSVSAWRESLFGRLSTLPGLTVYHGAANFLLAKLDNHYFDAPRLADRLLRERGIAIRDCQDFTGLDNRHFRVAVRTPEENDKLCTALEELIASKPARITKKKCARIMFQGTSSNAGKSLLSAALCRILLQEGMRVAPFKAQNMALNSGVTRDGMEMGRAQILQAQACRREPDVRMNPVLLKPSSDTGSQVIVMGKPIGSMRAAEYSHYKAELFSTVTKAYDSLSSEVDAIVIEGAGSPGEINLKKNDIVNMRLAAYAQSPVLIVGDIDRGGVYASFVGTMETLDEWERKLVAGFVVNKFRGDASLLAPAHDYVLDRTGKRVLGVVPYLHNHGLPEEDSVTFKETPANLPIKSGEEKVDIAIIDLPHISNFTDFDPLRIEPDANVRIVRSPEELGKPDLIILPGSKNTIGDLEALRQKGLAAKILQIAEGWHTEIAGICGGFQMLGKRIADPHKLESAQEITDGLGLLDVETTLEMEKTLKSAMATHLPSGLALAGYEIHHGHTKAGFGTEPAFRSAGGEVIGVTAPGGRVWGSYLHGLFDSDHFRRWLIDRLRERKGLKPLGKLQASYNLETALDHLAGEVRASLDMKAIFQLLGV